MSGRMPLAHTQVYWIFFREHRMPLTLRIWRFTDGRPGHEKQTAGLLQGFRECLPQQAGQDAKIEMREIGLANYADNWSALWRVPGEAPDLLIGAGRRTHLPMARVRWHLGSRSIVLMKPSLPSFCYDLALVPEHDASWSERKVLRTLGMLGPSEFAEKVADHGVILLGGTNDHFHWQDAEIASAVAVLAALQARRTTGSGQRVDISQFEVGINFIGPSLLDLAANGTKARPVGNDLPYDAIAPHGCFRCADRAKETGADQDTARQVSERWLAIACMNESQWQALCQLMEQPDWAQQDIFATQSARYEHRQELNEPLSAWTRNADALTLMQQCQQAGVPAGIVQDGADLVEHDPQLRQRGFLQPLDDVHPTLGPTWIDRLVIQFDGTPCDDYQRTRAVGEDSAAILKDWLDIDEPTLTELTEAGVLS